MSRINANDSDPNNLIPILFVNLLQSVDYPTMHIAIRRSTCEAGLEVPKVHGHDKQLDPNVKPEHQKVKLAPHLRTQQVQPPPMSAAQQAQK